LGFTKDSVLEEVCLALAQNQKDETWKAQKALFGLGFSKNDMAQNPSIFSGGYKIRINLAKVLLSDSDMLLLDEPNNYLDIVAIRWLSDFLKQWKGELILITHDRAFMDSVISHCAVIHRNRIRKVEGNTAKLYEQIDKEEEIYEKTRLNVEKKRKQTEIFISRFRAKARLASMVQSRIKSLQKQKDLEKLTKIDDLDFSFASLPFAAARMLSVHNLHFAYDKANELIKNLSFDVLKRERICIIGKNGKGKSTLLKLLNDRLSPTAGIIKKHPDLSMSYFVQSDSAQLNPLKTVYDEIINSDPLCLPQKARNIAGAMMFSGDDCLKKIEVLSGGEKSRVLLGKVLLKPSHLLLLDEPSNHLDMQSCESLIEAIDAFDGSVILVTHNEEILHNIAEKLIVFDRDKIAVFDGTYQDFLDTRGWEDEMAEIKSVYGSTQKSAGQEKSLSQDKKKKLKALIIQDKSKTLRAIEAEIAIIEKQIFEAEKELAQNNEALIKAAVDKNIQVLAQVPKINKKLQKDIETLYQELSEKIQKLDESKLYFQSKIPQ
jgi:ATP-binding cassette subfamily F protein 3